MATIGAGYDLLTVIPGTTAFYLDPIFPGLGVVRSDGVPIDPDGLGNFTTGFVRKGELPEGRSGVVPIEWFAEYSVSVSPVPLAPFGLGEGEADFHTVINLGGIIPTLPNTDGLVSPSVGVVSIRRQDSGGGRFDLSVNINPLIVLTKVGGSIATLDGPDVIHHFDASGLLNPVTCIGGQWADAAHPTRALQNTLLETNDNFVACLDRTSKEPVTVELVSGGLKAERAVSCALRL